MINILDPKIKGKRYRSGDELVDMLKDNFMGQLGMRIMQRPQGASVFKDEEGNFDKQKMDEFMNKIYIENVWYFAKNENNRFVRSWTSPSRCVMTHNTQLLRLHGRLLNFWNVVETSSADTVQVQQP